MRSYREIIRVISLRWIIKTTFRTVIYCLNPFRLIKWLFLLLLGAIFLGMLSLIVGNYANAAEWTPAKLDNNPSATTKVSFCTYSTYGSSYANVTIAECLSKYQTVVPSWNIVTAGAVEYLGVTGANKEWRQLWRRNVDGITGYAYFTAPSSLQPQYVCPPDGKPEFTMGPIVNANGTVCEKKPLQCLTGSVKDVNALTGKEFCRPICNGIAGNTLGSVDSPVKYFTASFGSVKLQCYGQCSIETVGGAITLASNPNIWQGVIKFTGQNCPVQHNGESTAEDVAGTVEPPTSSDATNGAQNELQNAASGAVSNTVSGATGTADLNAVVDKIAQASNAEIKASSEQNAALGKVIQNTGKDIQASIKEASLAASQGGSGASMGQIQTANAIKDGNAQLGGKLDAIKDAIEAGNEDGEEEPDPTLPPGDTDIKVDPNDVNPHPNDWGTRNYKTVMQHHVTEMNALPLFSGIGGFFEVDMGEGSCPSFSVELPELGGFGGGSLEFDVFCTADLQSLFVIIALCVKLFGLYVAFRIALLD